MSELDRAIGSFRQAVEYYTALLSALESAERKITLLENDNLQCHETEVSAGKRTEQEKARADRAEARCKELEAAGNSLCRAINCGKIMPQIEAGRAWDAVTRNGVDACTVVDRLTK